ncbi:MAG TPA: hypothetical protein DEQ20_01625 [Desulfobulbaceae bacterium]|nr:MAG: hypothetical protein A2520_04140 [Deltaproteobacteria bacterium RIFOXYD12_FULL_53_23]HCC53617.1 hypothetical protein [Desulfobulbaceae bacterium]
MSTKKHPQSERHEHKPEKELRWQGHAPDGKKIKKEISRLWKSIYEKLEQGQVPSPAEEKSLINAFDSYTIFAEPTWHEEWRTCLTTLQQALACASKGDMPKAQEYAAEVNRLTKTCHKKYK